METAIGRDFASIALLRFGRTAGIRASGWTSVGRAAVGEVLACGEQNLQSSYHEVASTHGVYSACPFSTRTDHHNLTNDTPSCARWLNRGCINLTTHAAG